MARLAVLSPLPPARSDAALAGASLVRVLRRLGGHDVSAPWPLPESVEALLGLADLTVYHAAGDPEDREIYELAVERPGLVVLHDLGWERLIRAGLAARGPAAVQTAREALAVYDLVEDLDPGPELRVPWVTYLLRRARGVVVHTSFAARYVRALGTRTPVFLTPPPAVLNREPLRGARRRARRLGRSLGPGPVIGIAGTIGPEAATAVEVAGRVGGRAVLVGHSAADVQGPAIPDAIRTVELPERDLVGWLAACDVLVAPGGSVTGSIPTAVVRALQLGIPVAAGRAASLPDGVEPAVPVADPRDAGAVEEAVRRALADPSVGDRGRLAVERLAADGTAAYAEAVDRTLALLRDPLEWTLARWAEALLDSGVAGDGVARGYGTVYTAALEELRPR
jgi:glycosyltransferase involved in cell wall biosynthesis